MPSATGTTPTNSADQRLGAQQVDGAVGVGTATSIACSKVDAGAW